MGLDNGIVVKLAEIQNEKIRDILAVFAPSYHPTEAEVCYWRKCWGIRKDILDIAAGNTYQGNNGHFFLSIEDIDKIIALLKTYNKKNWDSLDTIWEWDEVKNTIQHQIKKLKILKKCMIKDPTVSPYFYDSY